VIFRIDRQSEATLKNSFKQFNNQLFYSIHFQIMKQTTSHRHKEKTKEQCQCLSSTTRITWCSLSIFYYKAFSNTYLHVHNSKPKPKCIHQLKHDKNKNTTWHKSPQHRSNKKIRCQKTLQD